MLHCVLFVPSGYLPRTTRRNLGLLLALIRAHLGLRFNLRESGLENEAAITIARVGAAREGSFRCRWMGGTAQLGWFGLWSALSRRWRQTVSKSSCAWAQRAVSPQGSVPRSLPGSNGTIGCFSHRPDALTCHPGRGNPSNLAAEGVPKALTTRRWPAAMTPRRAALRADDAVASHRAADGAGFPIKGARTHAHATIRGAVAGFPAFRGPRSRFLLEKWIVRGLAH